MNNRPKLDLYKNEDIINFVCSNPDHSDMVSHYNINKIIYFYGRVEFHLEDNTILTIYKNTCIPYNSLPIEKNFVRKYNRNCCAIL